jgi:hypothetical protein
MSISSQVSRERAIDRADAARRRAVPPFYRQSEIAMDEETFNLSIRKFLKMVGINSQREIERAVASAIAAGTIKGTESFPAVMTLEVMGLSLRATFEGEIDLQ